MPTAEQLSSTLEKIYAAAADPALWEEALGAAASFSDCAGAVLHVMPKLREGAIISFLGAGAREAYSPENVLEWVERYADSCPRLAAGVRWPDRPYIVDYMILSEAEIDRNEVYQWYGSYGLRYFVGSMLPELSSARAAWSLQRSKAEGHAQRSAIDAFLLLKPHVAQSIALAERLGTLGAEASLSLHLLEALPYALFGLDSRGEVMFANGRAERLIARRDGLSLEGRRLVASREDQPRLDEAINSASVRTGILVRGGWVRLSRPSGRRPYTCLISRVPRADVLLPELAPKALLIVTDSDPDAAPCEHGLRDLFDLTPAESRIAVALAAGHSVQSAAAELGVSVETLRTHLKHIFRKTGVSRQQDLIRALLELPPNARNALH